MITLNDFTDKRKLSEKAKSREEALLEAEVKTLRAEGETAEEIEYFLNRSANRYLILAKEAKTMLPYKL